MKRLPYLLLVLVAGCSMAWSQTRPGGGPKLANELAAVDPTSNVDVIVQYKVPPQTRHFDRVHSLGGTDKARFHKIPAAAFTVPASVLRNLASDPDVAYISMDRKV